MNTIILPGIVPALLLLCFGGIIAVHAQQVTDLSVNADPETGNDNLEITLDVPELSSVQLESSSDLSGEWVPIPGDATSFRGGPMSFETPLNASRAFFRFETLPIPLTVGGDGIRFEFKVEKPVPVPTFLDFVRVQTGAAIYPRVMDTELYGQIGKLTVPSGDFKIDNPTELTEAIGLGLWGTGLSKDGIEFADTYRPTEFPQDGKVIETPGGDQPMGDWEDEIQTRVTEGDLIDPGKFDMPFVLEIDEVDGKTPLDDKGLTFPGREARAFLRLFKDGMYELDAAGLSEGEHPAGTYPPLPAPGSLVVITRNAKQIIYLGTVADPFVSRAYNPPAGGAHGTREEEVATLGLTVPLANGDPNDELGGIGIEVYRYTREIEGLEPGVDGQPLLTPDFFARHVENFELLSEIPGSEVAKKLLVQEAPAAKSPTVTTLHRAGSNGSKMNIAVLGDGFADNAEDQQQYNDYVEQTIMEDFLGRDVHPEVLNAINVFRVNTYSTDSGVTQVNGSGTVTDDQDTALDYRYSGNWSRCWMEGGPNTNTLINQALASVCPQADIVFIVLNEDSFGGCAGGNRFVVTLASGWATVAHEFGHLFGKLGDEYGCSATSCSPLYTGPEPGSVNLTTVTNRNNVKWGRWIPSWRPVLTTSAHVADSAQDVGIFQGAVRNLTRWADGIFRPTLGGRMRSNSPPHNPIGYTKMRDEARPFQESTFRKNVVGDFNGDGRDDTVLLDGRQLSLYLAADRDAGPDDPVTGSPPRTVDGVLEKTWFFTDFLRSDGGGWSWQIRPGDQLYPADFDGDGDDDLYVFNGSNWNKAYLTLLRSEGDRFQPVRRYDANLPGWQMRGGDEHYVADIDGDGRDDFLVYNGKDWSIPYFAMFRAQGTSISYVYRYDKYLPGTWEMGRNERFFVGDFDRDGRDELIAQDRDSWNQVHLRVFNLNASSNRLVQASRYYGPIKGSNFTWTMNRRDDLYVGDFDGDGADDLALFNGINWNAAYLGLFQLEGGVPQLRRTYSNAEGFDALPGWGLQRQDRFWVANVDGDEDDDLIVYNHANWDSQYLGICRSNSSFQLAGSWQKDWIGGWNLGPTDDFAVADFRGGAGWEDLFVFNTNWFGLLRSYQSAYQLESINHKWITQHRYHGWGFW